MEPIQIEVINNTSWLDIINLMLNILTSIGTVGAVILSLWLIRKDEMKKLIVIGQEGMAIKFKSNEIIKIIGISCVNSGKKPATINNIGFKYENKELIVFNPLEYEYGKEKLPILLKEQESFSYSIGIQEIKNNIEKNMEKEIDKITLKPFVKDSTNKYYYGEKIEIDFFNK